MILLSHCYHWEDERIIILNENSVRSDTKDFQSIFFDFQDFDQRPLKIDIDLSPVSSATGYSRMDYKFISSNSEFELKIPKGSYTGSIVVHYENYHPFLITKTAKTVLYFGIDNRLQKVDPEKDAGYCYRKEERKPNDRVTSYQCPALDFSSPNRFHFRHIAKESVDYYSTNLTWGAVILCAFGQPPYLGLIFPGLFGSLYYNNIIEFHSDRIVGFTR